MQAALSRLIGLGLILLFSVSAPAKMTWQEMTDPNSYNQFAYELLQWTNLFDARPNYVALTPHDIQSLKIIELHLAVERELRQKLKLESPRPLRGLASHDVYLDPGGGDAAQNQWANQQPTGINKHYPAVKNRDPVEDYCQEGANCTPDSRFYSEIRRRRESATSQDRHHMRRSSNNSLSSSALSSQSTGGRQPIPSTGNFQFGPGGEIMECFDANQPCLLVGTCSDYCVLGTGQGHCNCGPNDLQGDSDDGPIVADGGGREEHDRGTRGLETPESSPLEPDQPDPSSAGGAAGTSGHGSNGGSGSATASAMTQAFQRCESNYQKALQLCGSSFQGANNEAVQGELNLRSGMAMAQYLQMARAASQTQGKSMYEICDTTEKMARSMTALNAAYTAICSSAQNSCASSCSQADSYLQSSQVSDADVTAALNSTSRNFDPARYYTVCKGDMNQQMTQGIFQTAQTAQMMAQANQCKSQIAASGPCALPEMWNSQACADHCKDPKNAYEPACARFTAMNSNCSNPEFAQKNPMCLCINNPSDPSCGSGGLIPDDEIAGGGNDWNPSVGRGGVPTSSGVGSFGSQQAYQGGAARGGQASSSSQGAFPGGGAGGPIMGSGSSGGGGGGGQQAAGGPRASGYKTGIIDGVQNYGGGSRGGQAQQRRVAYGDMNSQNPYRRIAVETDDPDFDLKQYLPPEDYEGSRVRKCYYGQDRIGCMHGPSLFEMVSRQYRKVRDQMMP